MRRIFVAKCQKPAQGYHQYQANPPRLSESLLQIKEALSSSTDALASLYREFSKPSPTLEALTPTRRDTIPMPYPSSKSMPVRRLMYLAPDARTLIAARTHLGRAAAESVQIHQIRHSNSQIVKMLLLLMTGAVPTLRRRPRKVEHLEVGRVEDNIHVAGLLRRRVALLGTLAVHEARVRKSRRHHAVPTLPRKVGSAGACCSCCCAAIVVVVMRRWGRRELRGRGVRHHLAELGGDVIHGRRVVRVVDAEHAVARRPAVAHVVGGAGRCAVAISVRVIVGGDGTEFHHGKIGEGLELLDGREGCGGY